MDTQEPEEHALDRSPELMSAGNTALVVVDVQEKLIGAIAEGRRVVWNVRRLIDGAKVLGVPVVGTEQYPRGLGPTVPELAERLGPLPSKLTFSGGGCPAVFSALRASGHPQSPGVRHRGARVRAANGPRPFGRRLARFRGGRRGGLAHELDRQTAFRRMESSGATLTTTESALFEWCEIAGTPEFKQISRLVREEGP